jgi:hypothetical protein
LKLENKKLDEEEVGFLKIIEAKDEKILTK